MNEVSFYSRTLRRMEEAWARRWWLRLGLGCLTLVALWAALWVSQSRYTPLAPIYPTGDLASYLTWAHGALPPGGMVWNGHYSMLSRPHPGPAYLQILAVGQTLSSWWGVLPSVGATWAAHLATSAVVVWSGWYLSRACRRWWPGICYVAAVATYGDRLWEVTPPSLVAATIGLAFAAGFATWRRVPGALAAFAVAGALLTQLYLESAPVGMALMGLAAAILWRRRSSESRASVLLGVGVITWTLIVGMVRLAKEGPWVLLEYWRSAREVHARVGSAPGSTFTQAFEFAGPWSAAVTVTVVVAVVAVLAGAALAGRGGGRDAAVQLAVSATASIGALFVYLWFIPVPGNGTQLIPAAMVVPLVVASATAAAAVSWPRPKRRAWASWMASAVSVLVAVCALWWAWDAVGQTGSVTRSAVWFSPDRVNPSFAALDAELDRLGVSRAEPVTLLLAPEADWEVFAGWPLALHMVEQQRTACTYWRPGRSRNFYLPPSSMCEPGMVHDVVLVIDEPGALPSATSTVSLGRDGRGRDYEVAVFIDAPHDIADRYQWE